MKTECNTLLGKMFGHKFVQHIQRKIPKGTQFIELEGIRITKGKPIKEKVIKIFCARCGEKNENINKKLAL